MSGRFVSLCICLDSHQQIAMNRYLREMKVYKEGKAAAGDADGADSDAGDAEDEAGSDQE